MRTVASFTGLGTDEAAGENIRRPPSEPPRIEVSQAVIFPGDGLFRSNGCNVSQDIPPSIGNTSEFGATLPTTVPG